MSHDASLTLLFDLDGTLSDNFPGISRSIRYALIRLGVDGPDDAELRHCVGPPLRETFARLLATNDSARIEQAIALYRERYADLGWRENTVYAGVPGMLASAATRPGRRYLCTSKPDVFARQIVALFELSQFLDGVYGADLEGRYDDKAKLLGHLAASEQVDPATAIMIGDRSHDVRAASLNGARSIGVLWGYGSRDELTGADAIITHPGDLMDAVDAVNRRGMRVPDS